MSINYLINRVHRSSPQASHLSLFKRKLTFELLEDRSLLTVLLDLGDAPSPYPTLLADDGASHEVTADGPRLGSVVDTETNGQPGTPLAMGDDNPGPTPDDEDAFPFNKNVGVHITPVFPMGESPRVFLRASGPISAAGVLNAWVDFNHDGDWDDAGEQIFTDEPVINGINMLTSSEVPTTGGVAAGETYARFRITEFADEGGGSPTGNAVNGEVEDYLVSVVESGLGYDYGDAPSPYPTLLEDDGARHVWSSSGLGSTVRLGGNLDPEADGQPSSYSYGDNANAQHDEDGVFFMSPAIPGEAVDIGVLSTSSVGKLSGWIDLNEDGDWDDDGEQILADHVTKRGNKLLSRCFRRARVGGRLPVLEISLKY